MFAVFATGFFKIGLSHILNIESPILFFFAAVTFSAWYGGARQGVLAIVSSLIFILYFFVIPSESAAPTIWFLRLVMYTIDCSVIVYLCSRLRTSKQNIDAAFKEIKTVETSLRHSEERLFAIFESDMIGLVFSKPDGRINQANSYFLNLLGYSKEKIENGELNWNDIIQTEDHTSDVPSDAYEKIFINANGNPVSVYVRETRVDKNETVSYVLDISERKRAARSLAESNSQLEERVIDRTRQLTEANRRLFDSVIASEEAAERLRESQNFLNSVVENIPHMIFVKEAEQLRFVRFNKAGLDLLGQKSEDMIGKNDFDFFPKEEAEAFTAKDREVLNEGRVKEIFEETLSTPTGLKYLHTKKIPIADKFGKIQYLLGISEDITEKKAHEQQSNDYLQAQLARSEAEKSAARLEFLAEASVSLSRSLDIHTMLNAFCLTITKSFSNGCIIEFYDTKTQTVGRMISVLNETIISSGLEESASKQVIALNDSNDLIASVLRRGKSLILNNTDEATLSGLIREKEFSEKLVVNGRTPVMILPLTYRYQPFGIMTLIRTNPGRPFTELDLSLGEDLAKRATFAIENARLFQKASEASHAKSAFLANISHEIRTPLGAMLGFAELAYMVMDGEALSEPRNHLEKVIKNGDQLLHIVDEVLDLAKVESEQILIEKISVSPSKILDEVSALLMINAEDRGLKLNIFKPQNMPKKIMTDPLRLRQILINIIGNAIKFTEVGKVDVIVQFPEIGGKSFMQISVKDSGIGITSEQAGNLFQPFTQVDSSMTRKFGGTGLGLFLSRKLARLLGGDVILHSSSAGEGSQFDITVEITTAAEKENMSPIDNGNKANDKTVNISSHQGHILVVDDSEDNRDLISAYLTKSKFSFDLAENGIEGVEKALNNDYDIILMDIQMPKMDGFEAVQFLRDKHYTKPVVAVTAHAMKGYRERCLNSGFDDYLCKPLSWTALMECVDKFMMLKTSERGVENGIN